MSAPAHDDTVHHDPVEDITKHIPVVIPLPGAAVDSRLRGNDDFLHFVFVRGMN